MAVDNITAREKQIGKAAAKMAHNYVQGLIAQKLTVRGKGIKGKNPLAKSTRLVSKMGQNRLLGIDFKTTKVGYVQHFGFTGTRYAGSVELKDERYKKSYTSRKPHSVKLKPQDIFKDIYTKSGAFDYLMKNLSETRSEAIIQRLTKLSLRINKET
jgi:hypothetical protein